MLRIGLIDGDPAIRAGRSLMINAQEAMHLVYEEASAVAALERIPDLLVDVLVIDHRLQGFDGVELARRLVDVYSERGELCPAIVITGPYATPDLVMSAIRCGATDVVTQDAPMSELLTAIKNAGEPRKLADFSGFDLILSSADYVPKVDPLFVLRRSQLRDEQARVLGVISNCNSLIEANSILGMDRDSFTDVLNEILIALHFATYEQLYLALHDSEI